MTEADDSERQRLSLPKPYATGVPLSALGREPLDQPGVVLVALVAYAVMQAVWTSLPKLDAPGRDAVAAPMSWPLNPLSMHDRPLGFGEPLLDPFAVRDGHALR